MTRSVLAFPKPVRQEDADYLRFIKRQPCVLDHLAADAHHVTSRGAGGSDYQTIPLCRKHHRELHHWGRTRFESLYTVNLDREMVRFLEMYVSALRDGENLGAK